MKIALAAAVSVLALAATPGLAQTPAPAAAQTVTVGVSPASVSAWLATKGATVGAVQTQGTSRFLTVTTDGLTWRLFFPGCQGELCGDVQFSTGAQGTAITPDLINGWNRDRRFLKAIYEAPTATGAASAVVQYDVLVAPGGPEQLADPLTIWRGLLPEFAKATAGAN